MAQHLNKNKAPDLTTLAGRLAHCVEKAGGKRKLAAGAILSEAQLFRYLQGLSDIPSERLITIAHAAEVDAGWLLTGAETGSVVALPQPAARPPFRPALMQYVARMLDEFLVEYQRSFSPRVKSQLLTLIYESLRHDEVTTGKETFPNKFQMLCILNYLEALKTEEQISLYHRTMELMEHEKLAHWEDHRQMLSSFCSLVKGGYETYYNSYAGAAYYERVGIEPLKGDDTAIDSWLEEAFKTLQRPNLSLLDVGCGNGRYLNYLHRAYPKLELQGVDVSNQAVALAKKLEQKGTLPPETVRVADCCELPFGTASFDLAFSRHTLHYQPYFPGSGLGIEAALQEIHRILKPGGMLLLMLPYGAGRGYTPFTEHLTAQHLRLLAEQQGFTIKALGENDYFPPATDSTVKSLILTMEHTLTVVLEK